MARKSAATEPETALTEELNLTFEQAYKELEAIVAQLEQGELPLEQSLALHARGQKLAAFCNKTLEEAELKVKVIGE
jgi:exodeoxyribonuclease VII small subunit